MKTVSLIMSVYDEENTVGVVLDKLRNLDFLNEIVLVDNGSTDSTYDVLLDSQKKDNRIKIYRIEKNKGLGCGIKLAIENGDDVLTLIKGWKETENIFLKKSIKYRMY